MNQSGVVDFLNLRMKKMGLLQILELFTEIIEKYGQTHQNFQTQNISIDFIKAMLTEITFRE